MFCHIPSNLFVRLLQVDSNFEEPVLAVSAMAGIFPTAAMGNACNDAPKPVPLERWDVDGSNTGARFGAFVEGADLFDAAAFSISRLVSLLHPECHFICSTTAGTIVLEAWTMFV